MTHLFNLTALLVCICVFQTINAIPVEEYRRALQALELLEEENEAKRGVLSCKAIGQDCKAVVKCCGTTQCYWAEGYSMIKSGECVKCVKKSKKCQRDSQCCSDLQCDKGNRLWMDGSCQKYRRSGSCYRDGQCVNDCKKKWYQTSGTCQ